MTRKEKLIAENPLCCFCGGLKRSENTEHYPPRTLFDNKDRPKGFEFASCISCNDSSRCTDSVVSLFALMSHKEYIKAPKKLNKLAKGVQRNCPISWQQLSSSVRNPEQLNFELKGLVLGSNIVSHIEYFTRKMICATYYYDTKKILPLSTPTDVIIQTEYDRLTGKFPFSEIDLGKFRTLIQGRKNKSDEFRLRHVHNPELGCGISEIHLHNQFYIFGVYYTSLQLSREHASLTTRKLRTLSEMKPPLEKWYFS